TLRCGFRAQLRRSVRHPPHVSQEEGEGTLYLWCMPCHSRRRRREGKQTMGERPYVAADATEALEWERLELLQTLYDASTTQQLARLGIKAGWQCLEVGAGRGSIAHWLAECVGPAGRVVAADMDPRLLRRVSLPSNIEIRPLNILTQAVEGQQYDLLYFRAAPVNRPPPAPSLV